jgi:hypothetical protein
VNAFSFGELVRCTGERDRVEVLNGGDGGGYTSVVYIIRPFVCNMPGRQYVGIGDFADKIFFLKINKNKLSRSMKSQLILEKCYTNIIFYCFTAYARDYNRKV